MRVTSRKCGILIVSFGSSREEAGGTMNSLKEKIGVEFPGWDIFHAVTSGTVRQKLAQAGKQVFSPADALYAMEALHFKEIVVLSLHLIPGEEYHSLENSIEKFRKTVSGIHSISLSRPLLYSHDDLLETAAALATVLPAVPRRCDAVVVMGHGTRHPANVYYPAFGYYLRKYCRHCLVATIEGFPALADVMPELEKQRVRRVCLFPLLAVAGKHALEDMAGDKPDSWKKILEAEGYEIVPVAKGLVEYEVFQQLWINRLKRAEIL